MFNYIRYLINHVDMETHGLVDNDQQSGLQNMSESSRTERAHFTHADSIEADISETPEDKMKVCPLIPPGNLKLQKYSQS